MIKKVLLGGVVSILFIGCSEVSSRDDVNRDKSLNNLGYYDDLTLFHNSVITSGIWLVKDKKYGFEYLYYFKNDTQSDINTSQIDNFYNNENYGVDITGNRLNTYKFYRYSETNETNKSVEVNGTMQIVEDNVTTNYEDYNKSIIEYFDFNNVNKENDCLAVSKYEIKDNNETYIKDLDFCANAQGYSQYSFAGYSLPGIWIQYEYDDNDTAKTTNGLGLEFLYQFDYNNKISMNISIIDTWIPLGKYATDKNETILTYEEGSSTSLKQFEFIEHREPVPFQYKDENNETQTIDMPCIKVKTYKINENNNTKNYDNTYQLCKKY